MYFFNMNSFYNFIYVRKSRDKYYISHVRGGILIICCFMTVEFCCTEQHTHQQHVNVARKTSPDLSQNWRTWRICRLTWKENFRFVTACGKTELLFVSFQKWSQNRLKITHAKYRTQRFESETSDGPPWDFINAPCGLLSLAKQTSFSSLEA